ncbi:MAG: MFS transporter [Alphaproteobacteria bacterium]|nr:MFS transporter [Alphaproteobacteria bacterium]
MTQKKVFIAGTIGNVIEFYDFTLYGFFAPIIAQLFFPSSDPRAALLSTLAIFAAGFLMRPIGGIIFGHIGDKLGRKVALSSSILLMSFPTAIIGILPSYDAIGIWASIILMVCRLSQGLSTGGEYNGAFIFLIEHGKKDNAGFLGSLVTSSCALGALLAVFSGLLALREEMPSWAWRVPFLLGSLGGIIGFYLRNKIDESPEFLKCFHEQSTVKLPLAYAFREDRFSILRVIAVATFSQVLINTLVVYTNIYLNKNLNIPLENVLMLNTLALLVFTFTAPLAGFLSDKFGQIPVMFAATCVSIAVIYPVFLLFNSKELSSILYAEILLSILAASYAGTSNAFIYKSFPPFFRYSGSAFSYGVGGILGGATPFILSYLIYLTGNTMMPPLYIIVCSFVCTAPLFLKNKNKQYSFSYS